MRETIKKGIEGLSTSWAEKWTISNLQYDFKCRGLEWEKYINPNLSEEEQKRQAALIIEADAFLRRSSYDNELNSF